MAISPALRARAHLVLDDATIPELPNHYRGKVRDNYDLADGRRILITGLLSNRSIAYGVAKAVVREGGEVAFTYQGDAIRERVEALAQEFNAGPIYPCDVADDAQIDACLDRLKQMV